MVECEPVAWDMEMLYNKLGPPPVVLRPKRVTNRTIQKSFQVKITLKCTHLKNKNKKNLSVEHL